jgi:two-component system chemotaxis sensor kinase CheA
MNELLEQFLSEAREALQGIGEKLMELEAAPDDQELMTQLFRLVHTLKGNSGLFEFPEMTRVLHAGEDLMDAVRNGRVHYSQALADRLLDAMDFVGMLCDDIEAARSTSAGMVSDAAALARTLRALIGTADAAVPEAAPAQPEQAVLATETSPAAFVDSARLLHIPEVLRLAAWRRAKAGEHLTWVHYTPSPECFFQGEDPLHQARLTPGFLWGGMRSRAAWPALAELDAYHCMLDFEVLCTGARSDIEAHYRYVADQIAVQEVVPLALVLPQGDPNGGPVYEDFVADALALLALRDVAGLQRCVRSMLELSSSALWLSSALRWTQALLECTPLEEAAVRALLESLRTLTLPQWSLARVHAPAADQPPAVAEAGSATVSVNAPQSGGPAAGALAGVIAVQREILSLPDDAAWMPGRVRAVAASLAGCLRAAGRAAEQAALQAAAEFALQERAAAPLARWLDAAFPAGSDMAAAAVTATATARSLDTGPQSPPLPEGEATLAGVENETRFGRRADDQNNVKSLKVDQVKVDRLMNLIGEMVVAKNAIPYLANRAESVFGVRELSREIQGQYAVINRIAQEMQDAIMQVRMMPVSFVMQRFPRLVRDISRRLGKEVNLVLEGQDTAADKNIIESLGDPLVHIVRNSLDHGLELPAARAAAGKPPVGTLKIAARQESDRVIIEISDDGRGIDPAVIKRKAYEKGLIDEHALERISDQEAINLVFAAGFSTADAVSDLSGRGVGMDVVRTAVERVNGSIALDSVKGKGTTLRLSLPLSMAVSNVMTIESDGQMFGVPMDSVVETVRIPRARIRSIKQRLATVLRGRVVPLLPLNSLLGMAAEPLANDEGELAALVVRHGEQSVGLLVDDFHGTADIILKPLTGVLGGLLAYSGSALMGDGSVLMVLNVKELL